MKFLRRLSQRAIDHPQASAPRVTSHAPINAKAHFFFGLDRTFAEYAKTLYEKAATDPNCPFQQQLGTIDFPPAKETPQLQAADLLVHLNYQYAQKMLETNAWGKVMPDRLLSDATSATLDLGDHSYQNRSSLEITLTVGIEYFLRQKSMAENA